MRTDRLRINQISPEAYRWYLDYLGAFLAGGCASRMNNQPPTVGKEACCKGSAPICEAPAA